MRPPLPSNEVWRGVAEATDGRTERMLRRLVADGTMPDPTTPAFREWYNTATKQILDAYEQLPPLPATPTAPVECRTGLCDHAITGERCPNPTA